jgi:tRNA(Ile)-lysidine synthase
MPAPWLRFGGLRGIEFRTLPNPWSDDIPLVRPLLSTFRVDIQNYVDENELEPVTDRSNLIITYYRNRIRHELIPSLETYNSNIREVLLRMGQNLKDDYSILQQIANNAWESTLIEQGDGYVSFETTKFINFPVSIQRYLLRMAISYHLPGLRDVGFDCIERGLALLPGGKSSAQTDLIAGIRLIKEGKQFWVIDQTADLPREAFPRIPPDENKMISIPSMLMLDDGWQLHVEEIFDPELEKSQYQSNLDPYQAWMDISKLIH